MTEAQHTLQNTGQENSRKNNQIGNPTSEQEHSYTVTSGSKDIHNMLTIKTTIEQGEIHLINKLAINKVIIMDPEREKHA